MGSNRILVTGIRVEGRHGANPGETDEPQEFVVDLEVEVKVGSDSLDATADYRALVGSVIETVESSTVALLETLAASVAQGVLQNEGVTRARAVVHKPRAAESLTVGDIAAEATAG